MTSPLALIFYEQLLPGTQLVNRLQDLSYRVQAATDPRTLASLAVQEKPMLVIVDLTATRTDVCGVIRELRKNPETRHVPIIAYGDPADSSTTSAATSAGATLVAGQAAILDQLPHLLEQALHVE
jgi:PleD family two-component response regulator